MTGELALYHAEIASLLDRLCESIEGLSEAQLNWRPSAPDSNSVFVIATHILGNAEAWILGIACGQPIERDRPAEFRATGPTAEPIAVAARELGKRIQEALADIHDDRLGDERKAPAPLWGAGQPRSVSVREALMHVILHASTHLGQLDITKDLALASAKGQAKQ